MAANDGHGAAQLDAANWRVVSIQSPIALDGPTGRPIADDHLLGREARVVSVGQVNGSIAT